MKIAILAVGNEVLCGKIVNSNSAYLAAKAEELGAKVVHHQVVPDGVEAIAEGLETAYRHAQMVLTIGGLGPTVDDLTRQGVAAFFQEELVQDEKILAGLEAMFNRMGRPMTANNKQQALRFASGEVLDNPNGSAPGLFLEKNGRAVFLLPGPPNELKPMFEKDVLPYISARVEAPMISRSYRLYGTGESWAEDAIIGLYDKYPMVNIAPYASISYVDYILTALQTYQQQLDELERDFLDILGEHHVGTHETNLPQEVVRLMADKGLTLAVAESCTGGLLASEIVNVSGASQVLLEGLVTYSNESKMSRLQVKPGTLEAFGAVSAETALEMAVNLKAATGADAAIAITGVAGPGGGTPEKPVGLVFMTIILKDRVIPFSQVFNGNREKVRLRSTNQALYLLYRELKAL